MLVVARTLCRVRWLLCLTTTAAGMASVLAWAAAAGQERVSSPQGLYQALLTTPIRPSAIPGSRFSVHVGVWTPSGNAQHHHVVGEVEVTIDNEQAKIGYLVFPSHYDAVRDWNAAGKPHALTSTVPVHGLPKPAVMYNGSVTGKDASGRKVTNGITLLGFVAGSVIVEAGTASTDNPNSGDVPATIALGKYALRHLQLVEAKLTTRPQ